MRIVDGRRPRDQGFGTSHFGHFPPTALNQFDPEAESARPSYPVILTAALPIVDIDGLSAARAKTASVIVSMGAPGPSFSVTSTPST
jgi:hypothetical protein